MPAANINREFQFALDPTPESLKGNDKAIVAALAEIYSNRNLALNARLFTTTVTLDVTDTFVYCTAAGGAYTLTLSAANAGSSRDVAKSKMLILKHLGTVNNITVSAGTGDTIDLAASTTLVPGAVMILFSDGANTWFVVSRREKATWTPTDGSGAGLVLTVTDATYVRNGDSITLHMYVTYPVTASGANAQIGGLPYAPASTSTGAIFTGGAGGATTCQIAGTNINIFAPGAVAITNANLSGAFLIINTSYIV